MSCEVAGPVVSTLGLQFQQFVSDSGKAVANRQTISFSNRHGETAADPAPFYLTYWDVDLPARSAASR